MSYKFEELRGDKIVIHCSTKELDSQVIKILQDKEVKWCSGETAYSLWDSYKNNTAYRINHNKTISYSDVAFYRQEKYTIISAEDFIRDNTIEKPKTFQVDGTPNLIKAFIQELKELGYIFPDQSRQNLSYNRIYCNNTRLYNEQKNGEKDLFRLVA